MRSSLGSGSQKLASRSFPCPGSGALPAWRRAAGSGERVAHVGATRLPSRALTRPLSAGSRQRASAAPDTGSPVSPLDVLRKENELLKATISDAKVSIGDLEQSLQDAGVTAPPAPLGAVGAVVDPSALQPEDFWSPAIEVPPGFGYQEEYGPITPVPNHDGTECLQWDNTLWAKGDHFKVTKRAGHVQLRLPLSQWQQRLSCCGRFQDSEAVRERPTAFGHGLFSQAHRMPAAHTELCHHPHPAIRCGMRSQKRPQLHGTVFTPSCWAPGKARTLSRILT